ncbi:MAG: GTPase/DUF3482 domain-containing protein [Hahellaceae bacterium]|jgi:hypothetical protein|nr:GTPase/DUF3482 domain-containing protein [Hahellaceae bacterium]
MSVDTTVSVAVVGHTNAGKTSLMRTLLRDSHFGTVANTAGTTRHVEGGALLIEGKPALVLFDTPGLEDSMGLLSELDDLNARESISDGPQLLQRFLDLQDQYPAYEQEAKVIRQLLRNTLIFYVIDVREPVLGKYKDEITLLGYAAKPIIPVLNFVAHPRALTPEWKKQLTLLHLHAMVDFDNVVFRFEDEKRLLQKMQSLLSGHHEALQRLIDERSSTWKVQLEAAAHSIADTLIRVGALRLQVENTQPDAIEKAVNSLQSRARQLETQCLHTILTLFGFSQDDVRLDALEVRQNRWARDLFDRAALRRFGLEAGSDAAKGAAMGAGVDLVVGGISLGAASALGALAGFVFSAGKRYGQELTARLKGHQILCIDDATLKHLWSRLAGLLLSLQQRGHAAQNPSQPEVARQDFPEAGPRWLKQIRANPEWGEETDRDQPDPHRQALRHQIAETLLSRLH